jgi:hypothetical protein
VRTRTLRKSNDTSPGGISLKSIFTRRASHGISPTAHRENALVYPKDAGPARGESRFVGKGERR